MPKRFKSPEADAHENVDLAAKARELRAAVERDDARLVDHLVADHDVARRLHDLVAGVVDRRRQRPDHAARDAAVVEAAIRVRIGGAAALALLPGGSLACEASFRQRRDTAVRWIDDQRRLALRVAALEPVRRRRHRAADGSARRRGGVLEREVGIVENLLVRELRLAGGVLLVREPIPRPELLVALHRHADHRRAGPDSGEIRVAPRRARHSVGRGVSRISALLGVSRQYENDGSAGCEPRAFELPHSATPVPQTRT